MSVTVKESHYHKHRKAENRKIKTFISRHAVYNKEEHLPIIIVVVVASHTKQPLLHLFITIAENTYHFRIKHAFDVRCGSRKFIINKNTDFVCVFKNVY